MSKIIHHLRRTVLLRDGGGMTDDQLLGCFIEHRDEAAFEAILRRHGPMVLGVCRRVLHNPHDAEDAFQATFLVLVRKAASIVPREMVGNWLYGVAYHTALKAKAATTKRRVRERQVTMPQPEVAQPEDLWHDLQPLLDQELARLPDKYRVPVVLCDLEDKTRKEAARQLGWPEGTLSTRLATARRMLAKRLARHGLALSGGALALVLSQNAAPASVPACLVISTVKAASLFAAGQAAAGLISAKVAALTEGVLKSMLLTKLKIATAVLLVLSTIGLPLGAGVYQAFATEPSAPRQVATTKAPTGNPKEGKTAKRKGEGQLPSGPAPTQALVSLNEEGQLVVRTLATFSEPTTTVVQGRNVTSYKMVEIISTSHYDGDDVRVYDVKGKSIAKKQLPKLLEEEIPALVSFGGHPVDPLHLRLMKDGTLLFVLPPTGAPPLAAPAGALRFFPAGPVQEGPVYNPPIPPPAPPPSSIPSPTRQGEKP